jgi:hypothetical protein
MPPDLQDQRGPNIRSRTRTVILAVLVGMLFAALLAYLGATRLFLTGLPPTSTAQPQPTSVHVVRIPGAGYGTGTPTPLVPLDRTITDTSWVQHLYQTALHLPGRFLGEACAPDPEAYMLTFYRSSRVLLTMQAHTGLCGDVTLDRGNPADTGAFRYRRTTPTFWSELADLLGLPLSAVDPVP